MSVRHVTYLLYSALFIALLAFLGAGLTLLLMPASLRRYSLLFGPLVGHCYMTLAGWYFFVSGFPGTDSYARLLLVPPLAFLGMGVRKIIRERRTVGSFFNADVQAAFALGLVAFLVVSLPSVASEPGLTAISLGNADIADSSVMARYIRSFQMNERTGFLGQDPLIARTSHDRFGAIIATALPSSLFSLETYQLQNLATNVFFAIMVSLTFVMGRELFNYSIARAAIGATLVLDNPLLYYTAAHNFQAQILGMALAFAIIVLNIASLGGQRRRDWVPYLPLTALMTWGLSVTYGHMLFPLMPAIGVHVLLLARPATSRVGWRWAGFCLAVLGMTALLSIERVRLAMNQLIDYGGRVGGLVGTPRGWFIPWLFPSGLFTMPDAFPWVGVMTPPLVRWSLAGAVVVTMALGIRVAYRAERERLCTMTAWLTVSLVGGGLLAFVERAPGGWGGYSSYKWLSFFLPLVLLSLVAPGTTTTGRGGLLRAVGIACVAVIMSVGGYHTYRELQDMMHPRAVVSREMAALREIEADPRVDSVNILGTSGDTWNTMWRINFLLRKKLYPEWRSYYPKADALSGRWNLVTFQEVVSQDGILVVGGIEPADTIPVNREYLLVPASRQLLVRYGAGWYPADGTMRWTGNGSASAEMRLNVSAEQMRVSLATEHVPLDPRNELSIYLDGRLLHECPSNAFCLVPRIDLSRGPHGLEFRTALPPARPASDDPRTLAYAFAQIVISPLR